MFRIEFVQLVFNNEDVLVSLAQKGQQITK